MTIITKQERNTVKRCVRRNVKDVKDAVKKAATHKRTKQVAPYAAGAVATAAVIFAVQAIVD